MESVGDGDAGVIGAAIRIGVAAQLANRGGIRKAPCTGEAAAKDTRALQGTAIASRPTAFETRAIDHPRHRPAGSSHPPPSAAYSATVSCSRCALACTHASRACRYC